MKIRQTNHHHPPTWSISGIGGWLALCLLLVNISAAQGGEDRDLSVHLRGVVLPVKQSKLALSQSGTLVSLIREGTVVKKGAVLAQLKERSPRLEVARMKGALAGAKLDLTQAKGALEVAQLSLEMARHEQQKTARLQGESIVSRMAVEEAEFSVRQARFGVRGAELAVKGAENSVKLAENSLQSARLSLSGYRLEAPFDGIVTHVMAQPGEWTAMGNPILELADMNHLQMIMDVPPALLQNLTPGTKTDVLDQGRKVGVARAETLMPFVDPASGLQRVIWQVTPQAGQVLSGRYMTLRQWQNE
ncbi:MAG: HlyD family efflux transporter periplasmic adaptor subunit [Magnetococcales bacterium]|nr:HlyD family efflux transporter periplasmic adaptor subunit [Magnetococcales bacterium]